MRMRVRAQGSFKFQSRNVISADSVAGTVCQESA